MTPRIEVLTFIRNNPGVTIDEVAEHFSVHRDTANQYVLDIERAGKVVRRMKGTGPGHRKSRFWIKGKEPKESPLTGNERLILGCLKEPKSMREISEETGLHMNTVASVLTRMTSILENVREYEGKYSRRGILERVLVTSPWDKYLETKARSLNALTARL